MSHNPPSTALIWRILKAHPGMTSAEVIERMSEQAPTIQRQSIWSALNTMKERGKLAAREGGVGANGKPALLYEAVGDSYSLDAPEPPPSPEPPRKRRGTRPPAGTTPQLQLIFRAIKEHPGATSQQLSKLAERYGFNASEGSLTANLSVLKSRGIINAERVTTAERPIGGVFAYRTASAEYPPPKTPAKRRSSAEIALAAQARSEAPEPAPIASPAPSRAHRSKGVKTRWSFEEAEAICRVWAAKHLSRGAKLSERGLMEIAKLGGAGFRARPKITNQSARQFLKEHEAMLRAFIEAFKFEPPPEEAPEPAAHAAPLRDDDPVHPDEESESEEDAAEPLSPAVEKAIQRFHAKLGEAPPPAAATPQSLGGLIGQALEQVIQAALAAEMDSLHKHMTAHLEGYSERITKAIGDALQTSGSPVGPTIREAVAQMLRPKSPPAPKLPKVIVVNALGAQFESIKRAYPSGLDLRLVNDRMPGEQDADLVISLTKFIGHPLDRALRKQFGEKYCPVNGGADSVKLAIRARLGLQMAG